MIEPPPHDADPDAGGPPGRPSRFRQFIRGVVIGTVILNAATLFGAAATAHVGSTWAGFAVGVGLTAVGVIVALVRRAWLAAAGLAIALMISPLLAFPSCSLGGIRL